VPQLVVCLLGALLARRGCLGRFLWSLGVGYPEARVILGGGGGGACVITLWGSLTGGDEKGFLDFLTLVDERQHQEILVSAFKPKGSRELKCSINFDARGVGYSQGKGERALTLLYCSPWFSAGFCHGALGVSSILFLFLFFFYLTCFGVLCMLPVALWVPLTLFCLQLDS
jgi:hypothetical protein